MYDSVKSSSGWFHLTTALLAMISGAFVLATRKGKKRHLQIGYLYVFSMFFICGSAMGVYRLTGTFGIFHISANVGLCIIQSWGFMQHLLQNLLYEYLKGTFYTMVGIATGSIF